MNRSITLAGLVVLLALGACSDNDGPAENFGERIDDAVSDARERLDDAEDEAREAANDIRDALEGE